MMPTLPPTSSPLLGAVRLLAVVALLVVVGGGGGGGCDGAVLKAHFYRRSCPAAEAVVRDIVLARVAADPAALPAKLLRLFFHDCFVRVQNEATIVSTLAACCACAHACMTEVGRGYDVM
jgi:peroxidase